MKLKYYDSLDGVRGLAALMVMFCHFFTYVQPGDTVVLNLLVKAAAIGQSGVILFFVLSGFLITRILINTKNEHGYFSNFYARRSLRIFPLYFFFLFLFYFIVPWILGTETPALNQQIYHWTYLQNVAMTFNWPLKGPGHYWSLAVEEHFYLLWPLLVYFLTIKSLKKLVFVIYGIALVTRVILVSNGYDPFFFTLTNMDSLAIGAGLAIWEYEGSFKKSSYYVKGFIISLLPVLILWVFFGGDSNPVIQIVKPALVNITCVLLIGFVITSKGGIVTKFFNSKVMNFSGKISYGLYVYHIGGYDFIRKYLPIKNPYVLFICSALFVYLVAALSFFYFEKHFLELKKYFKNRSAIPAGDLAQQVSYSKVTIDERP